ncbi:hypothetical protein [Curtobacterium aetherium]|uniref:Uncharacterized protein n=1 Tax=Curtobacterium aetherium TaxID=2841594 RepID=A0ACD1E5V9_9MICO|nr:hypothetical protein [Curtobacterium sp. L6-1]QWS34052.1 hypothetical protein KM842_02280 [Curtobacterium sp. L6-1]
MTYALEHENTLEGQADGPYRTGTYATVNEAKRAGERLAVKGGVANVLIRDRGDVISILEGNLVSEFINGIWHDGGIVDVKSWWSKLDDSTRAWLLEHTDDQLPDEVLHAVIAAGGTVPGTKWEHQNQYDFRLPETTVAWIKQHRQP